ncbi:MAG: WYL domain-containing protein [Chloroflexi bacterium]|nr:WYL domain-containing protein [Chloroflexota bacterium]
MGERFVKKVQRMRDLTHLLLDYPDGLHKAEIARRIGVDRAQVTKDLDDLGHFEPVWEPIADKLYSINRENYRAKVELSLDEVLALHLATRLLTTRTDKHYPQAASALRQLGAAIRPLAPLIAIHMKESASILDGDHRLRDPNFIQNLRRLTEAWAKKRKVKVAHEMEDGRIFDYTFSPYFIEPYAVGRTLHVIGWREPLDKLRTFKIERIRTVEFLEETYEIPDDFDPREKLKNAWGIWYTEKEPVEVVLKFETAVAKRVSETQWHHTQQIEVLEDGRLRWQADVDEWREMLPWIRGWGADVEVLEPKALRRKIEREVLRMADVYKLAMNQEPPEEDNDAWATRLFGDES